MQDVSKKDNAYLLKLVEEKNTGIHLEIYMNSMRFLKRYRFRESILIIYLEYNISIKKAKGIFLAFYVRLFAFNSHLDNLTRPSKYFNGFIKIESGLYLLCCRFFFNNF